LPRQVEAVEVVSFGLEDHSRAVSGEDIIPSPSIKHTSPRDPGPATIEI
jgi:hypothetical protein